MWLCKQPQADLIANVNSIGQRDEESVLHNGTYNQRVKCITVAFNLKAFQLFYLFNICRFLILLSANTNTAANVNTRQKY